MTTVPRLFTEEVIENVGKREQGALDARRHTDAQNSAQGLAVDAQLAQVQLDGPVRVPQLQEQNHGADRIGTDGGDRHAVHGHFQHQHKEQVQQHIQYAGKSQGQQGRFRVAHAPENSRFKVVKQNHRHSQEVNAQVSQGHVEHVLRHVQAGQEAVGNGFAEGRHENAAQDGKQNGRMDGLFHHIPVVPAQGVGDDHVGAQTDAHEEIHHQGHDGGIGTDGGHAGIPGLAGEIAHHRQV